MSGYTVEVRTAILTGGHQLHTWLQITLQDGTATAWGFYPKTDTLGTFLTGRALCVQRIPTLSSLVQVAHCS